MSQINTTNITASEALQHRRAQHADATRIGTSVLYSEELGIDLARGTDAVYFRWFLASLLFGAEFRKRQPRKLFARSCAMV